MTTATNDLKLTQKQENFCLNIIAGMSQREAYVKAGYSDKQAPGTIDRNAYALAQRNYIVTRIAELKADLESKTIMSVKERKERLSELARARLVDFVKDGQPVLNKDIPNAGAAKEFYHRTKRDKFGNPIETRAIKLSDPIEAIRELNKLGGDYPPSKHLHAGRVQFEVVHVDRTRGEIVEGEAKQIEEPDVT